jgi:hypothetical protein
MLSSHESAVHPLTLVTYLGCKEGADFSLPFDQETILVLVDLELLISESVVENASVPHHRPLFPVPFLLLVAY